MKLEWLILADRAEVIGNKLYVMGGGWDVLQTALTPPFPQTLGLAASYRADWNDDTNRRQNVEVDIQSEDGQVLWSMGGAIEVGRPPGIRPGQDQRAQIAANLVLDIPAMGTYVLVARINGEEVGRSQFNVIASPGMPTPPKKVG